MRGLPVLPSTRRRGPQRYVPGFQPGATVSVGGRVPSLPGVAGASGRSLGSGRARAAALVELTKPSITRMVLVTTGAGFVLGSGPGVDPALLLHTLLGTGLVAGGTNAFNQIWEREADARMPRTRHRPLPAGRLGAGEATAFATAISGAGLLYLWLLVGSLVAGLVALSLTSYVFVYTPLKRRSPLCTVVGAVPGALPILAGWAAAAGTAAGGWVLFWILFVWQLPHFYALAWLYRDDYRLGGFAVVSVHDDAGRATGRRAFAWALLLVPVGLAPVLLGTAGPLYLIGAAPLGIGFAALAGHMARNPGVRSARRLFHASLAYLPLVLGLLVLDRFVA